MRYLMIILLLCLPWPSLAQRIPAESYTTSLGVGIYDRYEKNVLVGKCVGSIDNGDGMTYDLKGFYRLFLRVASPVTGAKALIGGRTINIPNTGGWQVWVTINDTFHVESGLKIQCTGSPFNLGYIDVRQWWDVNGDSTSILLPPSKDTIFTTEIDYWNGSVRAKKSVKWVRVVRKVNGTIEWWDNTGVKVDAIMYRNGYGNWVNL